MSTVLAKQIAPPSWALIQIGGQSWLCLGDIAVRFARAVEPTAPVRYGPSHVTAQQALQQRSCAGVIVDVEHPSCRRLQDRSIDGDLGTPLIVLIDRQTSGETAELLRNGVHSIVTRSTPAAIGRAVLGLISQGGRYAPVDLLLPQPEVDRQVIIDNLPLTKRQKEVAALIVEGLPNKEIAYRLGLKETTIKVYASIIFRRMGVRNRTEAAARVLAATS